MPEECPNKETGGCRPIHGPPCPVCAKACLDIIVGAAIDYEIDNQLDYQLPRKGERHV